MKKLLSVAVVFLSLCLLSAHKKALDEPQTIKVGALLSISGNWATLGRTSQEAIHLAVKEINSRMEQTGAHYRFAVTVYDTKLDTDLALQAIQKAYSEGVRYIIGPQSSAEVQAIRSFANEKGMLVISHGSTASSLAVAGDAIFRLCPDETVQADAMAQAMYGAGHRTLISLTRDDVGNKELRQAVGTAFLSRGGTVETLDPWSITTTDFAAVLATLKSKIQQQSKRVGAGKVGVYLASFDKTKELFQQAAKDPVLSSVRWYGGDGIALSAALISDPQVSSFAAATHFFAPSLGLPRTSQPELAVVAEAVKAKTGVEADAYTLAAYDAMWLIARTVTAFPEPPTDFNKIKDIFQKEANQFYGITGHTYLNAAGDRATGAFDYWGVVHEGGTYTWKWIGKSL